MGAFVEVVSKKQTLSLPILTSRHMGSILIYQPLWMEADLGLPLQ